MRPARRSRAHLRVLAAVGGVNVASLAAVGLVALAKHNGRAVGRLAEPDLKGRSSARTASIASGVDDDPTRRHADDRRRLRLGRGEQGLGSAHPDRPVGAAVLAGGVQRLPERGERGRVAPLRLGGLDRLPEAVDVRQPVADRPLRASDHAPDLGLGEAAAEQLGGTALLGGHHTTRAEPCRRERAHAQLQ
jgi:hypothetical protein